MTDLGKEYWDTQYTDLKTIDGIGNVKDHSQYLEAFFNIEGVDVESLIDLGFGYGYLFKEMVKTFKPHRALGIEPSAHVFKKFRPTGPIKVAHQDILSWCRAPSRAMYDLGLCTSVLQYLTDKELKEALPIMAKRIRYLYLTVPTDVEYDRQDKELKFQDPYAKKRTRDQYQRMFRPHWTFLSTRILESKHFFDETNTPFNDLLFRF